MQATISPWGEKNFDASEASVRNSREGNVSDPLLSTSLTSSPEGGRGVVVGINSIETIEVESNMSLRGVDEVNDEAIHNSYGNQTQTAGLLHSVRNDMSGYAQATISPWGEKNFDASEASVRNSREGNVLAPNGIDTLPSPEFVNSQSSLTNSTLSHSRTLWARGILSSVAQM